MNIGEVRNPTNSTYQDRGSIHDNETAQRLGLRGGTIAASTHLDQFPPLLLASFGPAWFEQGTISLYFRHATTDGEPVQAQVGEHQPNSHSVAMMHTPEGTLVAEGTASVDGPGDLDGPTALFSRDLRHDLSGLKILANLSRGDPVEPGVGRIDGADQTRRIHDGLVTEPLTDLGWYTASSPWGSPPRPIATLSAVVSMFSRTAEAALMPRIGSAVGMWGAIEIAMVNGPVLVDTDYDVHGAICALGSTPQTEVMWYDMVASQAGSVIATMRILTRFMKASSPLYG
jgi:hypothetical protein